jgi:hypothetical protein
MNTLDMLPWCLPDIHRGGQYTRNLIDRHRERDPLVPIPGKPPPRAIPLFAALALALTAVGWGAPPPSAPTDTTLDTAQRLLKRTFASCLEGPIGKNADAGQVVAALRSSGDKDLLPFFQKLRQSKSVDSQLFGMVAATILAKQSGMDPESKDFNYLDLPLLFSSKDSALIGSAIASLIDAHALSMAQLKEIMASAPDAAHRAMAAGELSRLHKMDDRAPLEALLKNDKEIVRYYAAVTMLSGSDTELKSALDCLKELSAVHDLRQAPMQALMLVRIQKETLAAGVPWTLQLAGDEKNDEGLRYTAAATALSFKSPEAAAILADMIQKQKDALQQVKLGLIAIEYTSQIQPEALAPLLNSKSALAKSIAAIAQKAVSGGDVTPDLLALLKEGHPIVLDWALAYSDRADPERRLALRSAILNQATIVDDIRDRDFERAALAAQKILADDGDPGRKIIATTLKSENRAAVEAALAGIFRSDAKNQSELVIGIWDGLTKTTSLENATNYAALILAREGKQEALTWLPGMVMGGTAQGPGFRALAGWYYAKLKGKTEPFLAGILSN